MEVLLEVLMDIPSYPQWMYDCKQTIPLKQEGDLYRVLYFAQGVPLGSPDRDAVIAATTVTDFDHGTSVTTLQSIDNYPFSLDSGNKDAGQYNPNKYKADRQRMNEFSGKFELKMIDRHHTWVRYTAFTDPAGFAPRFIVKGVIRKVSFNTVREWRRMAKEQKYIEAADKGIVKPDIDKAIAEGRLKFADTADSKQAGVRTPQ